MSRIYLAGGFVVAAVLLWLASGDKAPPSPVPPADGLTLRGLFIGPTAADDAVSFGTLCDSIADAIEFDGTLESPRLKTGVQFDDLRTTAAAYRTKGVSIGGRQPHVRQAIHDYLDETVGVSGGPVSVDKRRDWVAAFRAIARACVDATK